MLSLKLYTETPLLSQREINPYGNPQDEARRRDRTVRRGEAVRHLAIGRLAFKAHQSDSR